MSKLNFYISISLCLIFIGGCDFFNTGRDQKNETPQSIPNKSIINPKGITIEDRFYLPENYKREYADKNSIAYYLRHLALKPDGANVIYYNGDTKINNNIYLAVLDQSIGNRDLHQCADAIMRLKAEFHWQQKEYAKIHFNLTNGFRVDYSKWQKGQRVKVEGNKTFWIDKNSGSKTYDDFWDYMEFIFMYAGTASLSRELIKVDWADMRPGDIFIQGGHPGHAVLVIDMATNQSNGEKVYMLAQSYMPAQETQILCNPQNSKSPWYYKNNTGHIVTPEWTFSKSDLMRFKD